jgi:hypothetical protein
MLQLGSKRRAAKWSKKELLGGSRGFGVFAIKAFNTTCRIYDFMLTGVKRVAVGTNIHL